MSKYSHTHTHHPPTESTHSPSTRSSLWSYICLSPLFWFKLTLTLLPIRQCPWQPRCWIRPAVFPGLDWGRAGVLLSTEAQKYSARDWRWITRLCHHIKGTLSANTFQISKRKSPYRGSVRNLSLLCATFSDNLRQIANSWFTNRRSVGFCCKTTVKLLPKLHLKPTMWHIYYSLCCYRSLTFHSLSAYLLCSREIPLCPNKDCKRPYQRPEWTSRFHCVTHSALPCPIPLDSDFRDRSSTCPLLRPWARCIWHAQNKPNDLQLPSSQGLFGVTCRVDMMILLPQCKRIVPQFFWHVLLQLNWSSKLQWSRPCQL